MFALLIKVWKERKWKARIEKGKVKVVENLKRLRVVWLLGFEERWDDSSKKKALHLLSIATILSSVWVYCRERAMVWILWISLLLFFLPSIFPVCFDFPYPFLSLPSPCGLSLQPWLRTFWSLILVFDYISGEDFWKLDL